MRNLLASLPLLVDRRGLMVGEVGARARHTSSSLVQDAAHHGWILVIVTSIEHVSVVHVAGAHDIEVDCASAVRALVLR